jgi:hypothetical protein
MSGSHLGVASRRGNTSISGVGEEQAELLGVVVGAADAAKVLGVRDVPRLSVLEGKKLVSMCSLEIGKGEGERGIPGRRHSPWSRSGPGARCSSSACRC